MEPTHTYIAYFLGWLGSLGTVLFAGSIYLVERRGKREPLHPHRQLDISSVLESIPEAALIIDTGYKIVDANHAAGRILGLDRDQILRSDARQLRSMLADANDGPGHPPRVLLQALEGKTVHHERRIFVRRKSNDNIELLLSATPIRNDRGDVLAALLIARDITELHSLQRRISDTERHLVIGQMAAALAHDFNNILAAIQQAAYILQTSSVTEDENKSLLDVIQNAVERGTEIIAGVREYLRTGSGAAGPVDLRKVMQEAVELTRPLWSKARVRVNSELDRVAPIQANAADMRRVFSNLIINAIEAMPEGGRIVVTCREATDTVVATVSDTGRGIPSDIQNKIFFPYFTTKQKGTGLGLSGAQKIVLAQGGNITFRSEPEKGTTFIVTMPVANGKKNGKDKKEKDKKDKKAA